MVSKVGLWKIISAVLAIVLILSIWTGGFGQGAPAADKAAAPTPSAPSQPSPAADLDMDELADDDPFLGKADAPVTIIEFSDYECPFCARFYSQTLGQIKSEYIDTGKVKFVYRDFPLSFHPQAVPSAVAANCAGEQDKYFEYHDKIFINGGAGGKGAADYKRYAEEISLDIGTWETCLNNPKHKTEIQKDMSDGTKAGIRGTPGFVINGQLISGAQPFSVFQQIIDAELQ